MSNSKGFFTVSYKICHLPNLQPIDVMVLSRICSFGVFFESAESTAEFINRKPDSVRNSKQKLERLNYIRCIENNGRGKKYIARADLRARDFSKRDQQMFNQIRDRVEKKNGSFYVPDMFLDRKIAEMVAEQTDEVAENISADTPKEIKVNIKPVKSSYDPDKNDRNSWKRWQKENPDLIHVYELAVMYLRNNQIPILNHRTLRKDITMTANLFRKPEDPNYHTNTIKQYLYYLDSDVYLYQLEHNKYCPRISTQDDLFKKFKSVKDFKDNPSRHYDPSKVLTN